MKKIVGLVTGILIGVIAVYIYRSPSIAFHHIEATIQANDIDNFQSEIDQSEIMNHLKNEMFMNMQDAYPKYGTNNNFVKISAELSPYFEARSTALATPISIFRELRSQLNVQKSEPSVNFVSPTAASARWITSGAPHNVLLSRNGLAWKLSALEFTDVMPMFFERPGRLRGIYYKSKFMDCCFFGKETETSYNQLNLDHEIDIIETDDPSEVTPVTSNVTKVQIGADSGLFQGIKDGEEIDVFCKSISQGTTGHYALPVYCEASAITPVSDTK